MFFAAAYTHVARGTNTLLKFATRLARIMLEFIIQSLIVGVRLHRKQFIKGGPWQQRVLVLFFTWWYYGSTIIEPSYLSTRKTLMCFSCNKAWSLLRSDTCGFLLVLCWYYRHTNTDTHTHTHTRTHTIHSGTSRMTHHYKYIFTSLFMCSAIFITLN